MRKTIVKSNSAFLIAGSTPSWKTGEEDGYLFPLVQATQFSLESERQVSKQVGSQEYAVNDLFRAPNLKFNTSYYASPYWANEYLMGMNAGFGSYAPVFSGISERNQNFYLIVDENEGKDAFDEFRKIGQRNLTGMSAVSLGNCFLDDYSVSFSVGALPIAGATFSASNIQFENATGEFIESPAINLESGVASGAGSLNLNNLKVSVTGLPELDDFTPEYNLPVASPQEAQVYLQDMQVGGIPLSSRNTLVQSFALNVNLPRQDLYGLGSNHVYGRKVSFPIVGSAEIAFFVSGLKDGNISELFVSESGYDLELEFKDPRYSASASIVIQNAKLDSYALSLPINDRMTFNAKYSFEITETGGLLAKVTSPIPDNGFAFVYLSDGSQVFLEGGQMLQVPEQFAN